jgi:hypothetical protein
MGAAEYAMTSHTLTHLSLPVPSARAGASAWSTCRASAASSSCGAAERIEKKEKKGTRIEKKERKINV